MERKTLAKITEFFFESILRELWAELVAGVVVQDDNSIDVNIQDQSSRAFGLDFHQTIGTTTLGANLGEDAYTFTAATGHGIQVGEKVALYDTLAQKGFNAGVLAVDTDEISIDTPSNIEFGATSTIVARSTIDMNVDGSGTRQTFLITNPFATPEHITRIMFLITTTGAPTLPKFGDLTALTRGLVLRVNNGQKVNHFNVKTNADMALMKYDLNFFTVAGQGQNGLAGRYTFSGQEKHGVVIQLNQGDSLEMIIQDDLTDLLSFRCLAQGHETVGEQPSP